MEANPAFEKTAVVIAIILYIASLGTLSYLSDANIFIVFIGTLPILVYLITFFYLIRIDRRMSLLWVLPVFFPLAFLFISYLVDWSVFKSIDMGVVTVLNIVISYLINIFVLLIFGLGRSADDRKIRHAENQVDNLKSELHKKNLELSETKSKLVEAKKELVINKENFNVSLRTIEDKCKAINFVIGRVYSDKRGANEVIRHKLRISSDLYNSFSEMSAEFKSEDAGKLHTILRNMHKKLTDLEFMEKDVFKIEKAKLPIKRDSNGKDRIIDVLKENDKDPIEEYHNEAKEVCSKMLTFLDENYLKSNTYFTE